MNIYFENTEGSLNLVWDFPIGLLKQLISILEYALCEEMFFKSGEFIKLHPREMTRYSFLRSFES